MIGDTDTRCQLVAIRPSINPVGCEVPGCIRHPARWHALVRVAVMGWRPSGHYWCDDHVPRYVEGQARWPEVAA